MPAKLHVHAVVSLPFEENTYVVWQPGQPECLVIDPGLEPDRILQFLEEKELRPTAILNTHGHADHIGGNEALKQRFPSVPLVIGAGDAELLTDANLNLSAPFGMPLVSPSADRTVRDGDKLDYGGVRLEVFEIPGHSLGHVVYLHRASPCLVFGGDVLFRGSVGRTDFPGGSFEALAQGIREKLFSLPDDTLIYPGHGPATTVGHERRTNPFVGRA